MKDTYRLYLNGSFYGSGSLMYMRELISDYIYTHEIYGRDEMEFKIVKNKHKSMLIDDTEDDYIF